MLVDPLFPGNQVTLKTVRIPVTTTGHVPQKTVFGMPATNKKAGTTEVPAFLFPVRGETLVATIAGGQSELLEAFFCCFSTRFSLVLFTGSFFFSLRASVLLAMALGV